MTTADDRPTACVEAFVAFSRAIQSPVLIQRVSRSDKEFHFQNWVGARLHDAGLEHDPAGRNSYPDFTLVHYPEGYEVKGLAWPGREANYDSNSRVPTGMHNDRTVYYVFGRYPADPGDDEYPVTDLVVCHGDFLNADHTYVHENKSFRGFGSYGDLLVRDRKMYVAPTPFALTQGTIGQATLIAPADLRPDARLEQVGELARTKEVHRPATSTHKWWAKRLGSVFRGILTAATTEDQAAALAAYNSATRLAGMTVFDPFAGSGTTVVEAIKLGATAVGWDINPVATLVQRQAVQPWDRAELERAYKLVETRCREEIDRVHRTEQGETVLYYFWVALATCPVCQADTRLFSTHVFSQNAYPKRVPEAQIVCPICLDIQPRRYDFKEMACQNGHLITRTGAVSRSTMTCPSGHSSKVIDSLNGEPPRYEMYAKMVLGFNGKKRYEPITDFDRALYAECTDLLTQRSHDLILPSGELDDGENTRQAIRWGFTQWRQFFNDRQLYSLGLLGSAIRELSTGPAEREALAALFSGTLEFNNMFCSFKGEGTGAVRHMFSHHVLKPERTPLEAHSWGTPASSGSFSTLFQSRLVRAHDYKLIPTDQILSNGKVVRVGGLSASTESTVVQSWPETGLAIGTVYLRTGDSSATDLPDESVDLVITDPPYMDNVHYSELADFFHTWLREVAPYTQYPRNEGTTRSGREVQSASPDSFQKAIAGVWRECARVLRNDGLLAFTFHQARLSGWVAVVQALAEAGFMITAVQPVKGEMTTSITKNGIEPSNLDAIIVCRKSAATRSRPPANPRAAAEAGAQRLARLIAAGIDVGAGDIRSVIRGQVLSNCTANPRSGEIQLLAALADELATEQVARLLPASAKLPTTKLREEH